MFAKLKFFFFKFLNNKKKCHCYLKHLLTIYLYISELNNFNFISTFIFKKSYVFFHFIDFGFSEVIS